MGDQKGKFFTRAIALLFVGMAFAGCVAILSWQETPLLVDVGRTAMVR